MRDSKVFLHELEILVNQQVRYVVGMAARCPVEGDPAWDRLLQRYGVQKAAAGSEPGRSRGAPTEELRGVLESIRTMATPALRHFEAQYAERIRRDPTLSAWVRRLRRRLETLQDLADDPREAESAVPSALRWSQIATV